MVEEEQLQLKTQVLLDLLDYNMKLLFGREKLTFGARGANKHLVTGSLLGGFFHMVG